MKKLFLICLTLTLALTPPAHAGDKKKKSDANPGGYASYSKAVRPVRVTSTYNGGGLYAPQRARSYSGRRSGYSGGSSGYYGGQRAVYSSSPRRTRGAVYSRGTTGKRKSRVIYY